MSKLKVDELEESTSGSNITVNTGSDLIVDDNIQLGHDSDTTLARASAGDISVEGNTVYRAGGTDVAVADGGTGAGTATAGFDALSPMTTVGDIMYGGSSGTVTRLAASTDGHVLTSTGAGSAPAWEAAAGGGASDIDGLSDAVSGIANFTNSLILGHQTTGTLSSADGNTAVGIGAMDAITSGDNNVVIGYNAATALTTGYSSVYVGQDAGKAVLSSEQNVIIGAAAGDVMTTASDCIAIGYNALGALTGDSNTAQSHFGNIAIGTGAMGTTNNDGSTGNVAIGYAALDAQSTNLSRRCTVIGYGAGSAITSGDENTSLGYRAGDGITTGNKDLCLGAYTDVGENHESQTCISIGYEVSAPGDRVRIGVASKYINCTYGDEAVWTHSSDERIKRNIQDASLGLSFINELRTVKYQWKPSEEIPDELGFWSYVRDEKGDKTSEKELVIRNTDKVMHGMIAQEIKVALDNAGVDGENFAGWSENENGVQEISESMFVYPLIKAIQELSDKVEALENA